MQQRPILLYLPTPPPYAGPDVGSDLLLRTLKNVKGANYFHVRSNVRADNQGKGDFNLSGIIAFARVYARVLGALCRSRPAGFCFLLSSNRVGFLRDSVIILTARLFGCHVVGHYRGANFGNFYRLSSPSLRWFIRFVLRRVDALIVQAEALKSMFDSLFPKDAIHVLPNGMDFTGMPLPVRAPSDRVRLLFVGHLTFAKGFYDLLVAYEALRKQFPQLELMFAGEIMDHVRQKARVAEFLEQRHKNYFFQHLPEISGRIESFLANPRAHQAKYLGSISGEEKRAAFQSADIFVLPSYTEGFSMAVLEAMAYGLPIVSTRVGALKEVLVDGKNGYLIEPGEWKMLAARLQRLIEDPGLRTGIGKLNAEHARSSFDIRSVANRFWEIMNP